MSVVETAIPGSRIPAHFFNPEILGLPWLTPGIWGLKKCHVSVIIRPRCCCCL